MTQLEKGRGPRGRCPCKSHSVPTRGTILWEGHFPQSLHTPVSHLSSYLPNLLKLRRVPRQPDLDPYPSPEGLGQKGGGRDRQKAEPDQPADRGPSMSTASCKLFFCFSGFTNMVLFHVTAISGAVNIAGGLFKKANDLKCGGYFLLLLLFFSI